MRSFLTFFANFPYLILFSSFGTHFEFNLEVSITTPYEGYKRANK
jgi:hypothetical protein